MEENIFGAFEDLFSDFADLEKAADILGELAPTTNSLSTRAFLSLVCMLLEEHCKSNELELFETVDKIPKLVREVNETFGAY